MKDTLVFDLETLRLAEEVDGGWSNIAEMGFGSACIYSYDKDEYLFFMSHQRDTCVGILTDCTVVSFNGIRFDNLVLLESNVPNPLWEDVDLFSKIVEAKFKVESVEEAISKVGHNNVFNGSLSLGKICEATLGFGKIGRGCVAPGLIKNKWWDELFQYNLRDVRLTRKLYEFIQAKKFCIDGHGNKVEIVL